MSEINYLEMRKEGIVLSEMTKGSLKEKVAFELDSQ